MGFFDFLSAPSQDHKVLAKKKGLTQEGEDFFSQNPPDEFVNPQNQDAALPQEGAQPKTSPVDQAEVRRAYANQESALIKREQQAISEVKRILGNTDSRMTPDLARVKDALATKDMNPKQVASDLDVILKKKGWTTAGTVVIDPGNLERLAILRNQLGDVIKEREQFEAQVRPSTAPQADAATLQADATEALGKAQSLKREASNLGVLAGEGKLKEAQNYSEQSAALMGSAQAQKPEQPKTFAEENSDPNLPPTNPNPITSEAKALGVKRDKLVNDTLEILKGIGINEDEWDDAVPTQAGLKRLLSVLDPEGTFAQKLAADIAAENRSKQPQDDGGLAYEQRQAEGSKKAAELQMKDMRSELKELYKSLNSQPFMQSWLGLTLYVILGMLTGPTNAAKILGIGRNRNAIMGEIESIKEEMRYTASEARRQEDRAQMYRMEAIRHRQKEQDYQRSKADSLHKLYINHKLILERAKQSASPQNRAIVSKLEGDFNRTLKLMSDAEKIMNNDWLDDNDPKKVRASREYARMRDEAEFIDQKLRALTEEIAPGTYNSEEEEAQTP